MAGSRIPGGGGCGKWGRCHGKDRGFGTGCGFDGYPDAIHGWPGSCGKSEAAVSFHEGGDLFGYDDFEYAQRAIKLNVTEYILKPVNVEELTSILKRIKGNLDQEIEEKRNLSRLRENYRKSLPIIREQFFLMIWCTKIFQRTW